MPARARSCRCSCGACHKRGQDGLSAEAGQPPQQSAGLAVAIGLVVLLLCLGFGATLVTALLLTIALGLLAWLSIAQIGGQTGDVLGAVEQASEIADPARPPPPGSERYFFTVEVMEPMTSEAILNSLFRLVMPWRLAIQAKSV